MGRLTYPKGWASGGSPVSVACSVGPFDEFGGDPAVEAGFVVDVEVSRWRVSLSQLTHQQCGRNTGVIWRGHAGCVVNGSHAMYHRSTRLLQTYVPTWSEQAETALPRPDTGAVSRVRAGGVRVRHASPGLAR